MYAVLRVDPTGKVVAVNDTARELLAGAIGSRCCDVVLARAGHTVVCEPTCAIRLARRDLDARERPVVVRGRSCVLVCARVGGDTVVVIRVGSTIPRGQEGLTSREREVLRQVAAGFSSAAIATRLSIHPSTVRTHVERAREKLGARTRAEAVARAIERGDIGPPFR